MPASDTNLPIGYWVKKVDELLTSRINETHQHVSLSRVGWQLLHTVCSQPVQQVIDLSATLAAFASIAEVHQLLDDLEKRDLLTRDGQDSSYVRVTPQGKQLHEDCFIEQQRIRQQALQEVSQEQYLTTVQTLQKIVSNLESA